ncbi:MAG: NAD(P)H-hydrate dehydratase [Burkholderiaceae bacterium]|nr:MAG: NAD(P)H-hydrate dehydratase [Burkholderiaceae bacterium]
MSESIPLLTAQALRAAEEQAQALLPPGGLMQRAGLAASHVVRQMLPSRASRVHVLAGPGNNGGDGFETATVLLQAGYHVNVSFFGTTETLPDDAKVAQQRWQAAGGQTLGTFDFDPARAPDLIVDALFGIGLSRAISGQAAEWLRQANALDCKKLALDIPSGLSADTGQIIGGADAPVFRARRTATFIAGKPGLYTADGVDCAGQVSIHDLGVLLHDTLGQLNHPALFAAHLPQRQRNTHKGLFGNLAIVGGQTGMTGAITLAAQAGLLAGAGRVFVLPLDHLYTRNTALPELMFRAPEALQETHPDAVISGPGMGNGQMALNTLLHHLSIAAPLLLDADALNLLASESACQGRVLRRSATTLLTPHPLEAARLLHTDVAQVQADRISAALALARDYRALVVLKGAGSVLADPQGHWCINPTGNALLSIPGAGDVLSGVIGSLIAQGMPPWNALLAAVWLHGAAAEQMSVDLPRHTGATASTLASAIRDQLNCLQRPAL